MDPDNIMQRALEKLRGVPGSVFKSVQQNTEAGNSERQELVDVLREQPVRSHNDLSTIILIEKAVKEIGGPDTWAGFAYWSQVCRVAGLKDNVGDWKNAPQQTAESYERIRQALLETTDRDRILVLLREGIPVPGQ
ncbi:hypothetical protein ACQ3G6_17640 [Allorhizobium undicola]|uniref:hypothetical protein n=1 Tax=Allorhizobium undicola TaxID=78527 RepID=UPI003D35190E